MARPIDLVRQGALILLGEPGVGKTTALAQIVESWDADVIHIQGYELTDHSFGESLVGPLRDALSASRELGSPPPLCVIDQVDESPALATLGRRLRGEFGVHSELGIRIVLACRTADLPGDLEVAVAGMCGGVNVADLLPLTRTDAEQLASSVMAPDGTTVDGVALVADVLAAGAGALAAVPLTLELLVRQRLRDGQLSDRAVELFAGGVDLLVEEWHSVRAGDASLTPAERLELSQEIAARLILCGRRTIWTGPRHLAGERDLLKAEALGNDSQKGSNRRLDEVLSTALFTGRSFDRLAFAHSSFASYLAARHLAGTHSSHTQLRSLFLVPTGEDRFAIPPSLRETAAWLVTLDPSHATWLIDADAESLAAHRAALDTPEVRSLIVSVLLRRAEEVELTGPWSLQYRSLDHPGLAAQLRPVLEQASAERAAAWSSLAELRLALRLSGTDPMPELVPSLLKIAANSAMPSYVRAQAVRTASATNLDEVTAALRHLLLEVSDTEATTPSDPLDVFEASLIEALWIDSLDAPTVLAHLTRRTTTYVQSSLRWLRQRFVEEVGDRELPGLLALVADQVWEDDSDGETHGDEDSEDMVGMVPADLVHELIDRAMASPDWRDMIDVVARLTVRTLRHRKPPLPSAMARLGPRGKELPQCREARRELALALLRQRESPQRLDAWEIAAGWSTPLRRRWLGSATEPDPEYSDRTWLLDADDFQWVYRLILCADTALEAGLVELGRVLLRVDRVDDTDLLGSDPTHPLYLAMSHLFEPVALDSPTAVAARKRHRRRPERDPFSDEDAEALHRDVQNRFDAAVAGDPTAYLELVHLLRFNPSTGEADYLRQDALSDLPGVARLIGTSDLDTAALLFLETERDRREEWLGTSTVPWIAIAGELTLGHLAAIGYLDRLSPVAWQNWAGTVLQYRRADDDHRSARKLLEFSSQHAAAELAEALDLAVRRSAANGGWIGYIEQLDARQADAVADTLERVLLDLTDALRRFPGEFSDASEDRSGSGDLAAGLIVIPPTDSAVSSASRMWLQVAHGLYPAKPKKVVELASALLDRMPGKSALRLAQLAGALLLGTEPVPSWPAIRQLRDRWPEAAHGVACETARAGQAVEAALEETDVADLYRWLAATFPPEDDSDRLGVHFVTPEDEARSWRDRVLGRLADRGTRQALKQLRLLSHQYPERLGIRAAADSARRNLAEIEWSPPDPSAVAQLLSNREARLVESDLQLAELIAEAFSELELDLPQIAELLWDRLPASVIGKTEDRWIPKKEAALGALLTRELQARLRRDVVVNREVLVAPSNPGGAYTRIDIKAEAVTSPRTGVAPTVMVELKGAWHEKARTAMRGQLEPYLAVSGVKAGVYVVACFDLSFWSDDVPDPSRRKARGQSRSPATLRSHLGAVSVEIESRTGLSIVPVVLEIPAPLNPGTS